MWHPPNTRRTPILAICAPILLCCACSGTGVGTPDGTRTSTGGGTSVPSAQGSQDECVEVRTVSVFEVTTRRTWNAVERILTATSSNGPGRRTLQYRYRDDGQIIAYIEVEQPFQHDFQYDTAGNRSGFVLSYPAAPTTTMPSSAAPWFGAIYGNDYRDGRLVTSSTYEYGADRPTLLRNRSTFTEDSEGRCVEIDAGDYGKHVLSYDHAGRVEQIVRTGATGGSCVNATTRTTYDDAGRVLETSMECSGGNSGPNNGGQLRTHTYHADGSETVAINGLTDVDDGRSSTTRSAACLAQDAALGKAQDARCRVGMIP